MLAKFPFGGTDTIRRVVPDARAARALEAALGRLPQPWRCLRNRRAAAQDGPPWVRCLVFHPQRGIALIDLLPTDPRFAVEPLAAFLNQSGLADEIGGLPAIVPVALGEPASAAALAQMLDAAFRSTPETPLTEGWADKVAIRLTQTPGLLLNEIPRALDPQAMAAVAPVPPLGSQDFGPPPPAPERPRVAALEGPEPGSRAGQVLAREQAWQSRRRLALGAGGALLLTAGVAWAMTVPALKTLMSAPRQIPISDAVPLIPPPAASMPASPATQGSAPDQPTQIPAPPVQQAASTPAPGPIPDSVPAPAQPSKPSPHRVAPDNLPMGRTPRAPAVTIQSEPELASPSLSTPSLSTPSLSEAVPAEPPLRGVPPVPAGALALSGPPPVAPPRTMMVAAPPPPVRPMRRYPPRPYAGRVHVEIHMPRWLSTMFSSR